MPMFTRVVRAFQVGPVALIRPSATFSRRAGEAVECACRTLVRLTGRFALRGGESVTVSTRGPRVSVRPGPPHPVFGHLLPPGGRSGSDVAC